MFQQAMMAAMAASQQPAGGSGQGGEQDLTQQVERMREMGIVDEGLAVRALQIMGGDLQVGAIIALHYTTVCSGLNLQGGFGHHGQ
jgi:hypothetical protein